MPYTNPFPWLPPRFVNGLFPYVRWTLLWFYQALDKLRLPMSLPAPGHKLPDVTEALACGCCEHICIGRGLPKRSVQEALVTPMGLPGDFQTAPFIAVWGGHAGFDPAVMLWSQEVLEAVNSEGASFFPGASGEQILVSCVDWTLMTTGVRVQIGKEVLLEITYLKGPCKKQDSNFAQPEAKARISPTKYPGSSRVMAKVTRELASLRGESLQSIPGKCLEPDELDCELDCLGWQAFGHAFVHTTLRINRSLYSIPSLDLCSDDGSIAGDSDPFEYEDQDDMEIQSFNDEEDDQMHIEPPEVRKAPYTIMNRGEIELRQKSVITEASELLQVSTEDGFVLLREYRWDLLRLQEAWFDNDQKVRNRCGLSTSCPSPAPSSVKSGPKTCSICMSAIDDLIALDCAHGFCAECWRGYLQTQVDDGKSAVQTRCPQHKCNRIVPTSFFGRFCDEERQKKYQEWCLRTYVDENAAVKWCTNPVGCQYACEYPGVEIVDVQCNCSFIWCWGCGEEAHKPASCQTVNQWNVKNSAESENISWIRAHTKKCPKCHKPIEKNQGCNHMVCSKAGGCGHEFCWLCLGDWSTHGTSTGGYYQCNIYDKQSKEGKHADEERSRLKAKHALDKYMFYFERFMDHDRGMKLTVTEEQDIEGKVQKLHDDHGFEIIELQFLYDALRQVRACRRVLKWTYVYGYYLDDSSEKNLFEFLQKDLEKNTDCLHEMLEKDFDRMFFNPSEGQPLSQADVHQNFKVFRSHATNYTNVTQKFMDKVLKDLGSDSGLGQKNLWQSSSS
ncbi:putative E3 ubiquitin-protein ligase ARI5 [Symbiodinium microadriaticum]|uniref:RBR-type E3 ubiquitin transferase n=1 Tax=Symbiodinium microadriaticum TaxID=2951 RepID=A0A1Q9E4R0_SYMMI|nr:putative E3 ubiquitin-protein ligase ARI5 [Symbiodinium microadriaticum]CAE7781353.1 ARI5 [Symbiodinium sp. KB8]